MFEFHSDEVLKVREGFSAGVWYNQICISECSLGNGLEEIKDGFMEIS